MNKYLSALLLAFLLSSPLLAQEELPEEEEDFSLYQDYGTVDDKETKRYASPKILGQSPAKLVSVGYDFQGPNTLNSDSLNPYSAQSNDIKASHGLRILVNLPVISHTRLLVNVGATFIETKYAFKNEENLQNPLPRVLAANGLRTAGLNTTIFKPFNEKSFALGFLSADLSGDYGWKNIQSLKYLRYSWLIMYGKRPHDRLQYAAGITQSYRAGEVNYFPVVLYNYTSSNRKWGIEALLPARAHYRRTFDARNILLLGFELEGQSYRLNDPQGFFPQRNEMPLGYKPHYNSNDLELRRSEIRVRAIYERALTDFIWLSTQVGYVINYRYDVDSGNFFRGFFGDQPYVMENNLTNPFYVNFSINLVSP